MKKKVWDVTVKDNPNKVVMGENDEFYTSDTEAYLIFNLQDKFFRPRTATLTLENRSDGSLKSEEIAVVDGVIEWEMPQRYIEHFGHWQGQLVYEDTKDGQPELYTSATFTFVVNAHIGDKKKPSLVEIENWEKFVRDSTELIETWEDMEDLRQANEAQRQANYQELLDTGVLQTNINTKLEALEEEYAPKLTEVTAQLAQTKNDLEYKINEDVQGLEGNINQTLNDKNKHRPIFVGMSEPSNDLGENGDLYLQTYADNEIRFYEEGTFTPEFTGSIAPQEVNYAKQSGRYIRIGDLVTVFIDIELSSLTIGSGAGEFRIYGLPYSPKIAQDIPFGGVLLGLDLGENNKVLRAFRLRQSSGYMTLAHSVMNGITNGAPLIPLNTIKSNFKLSTSFTYLATKNETMPLEKLV